MKYHIQISWWVHFILFVCAVLKSLQRWECMGVGHLCVLCYLLLYCCVLLEPLGFRNLDVIFLFICCYFSRPVLCHIQSKQFHCIESKKLCLKRKKKNDNVAALYWSIICQYLSWVWPILYWFYELSWVELSEGKGVVCAEYNIVLSHRCYKVLQCILIVNKRVSVHLTYVLPIEQT